MKMKTRTILASVLLLAVLTGVSAADVYNYTEAGMDGADWTLEKVDVHYYDVIFRANQGVDYVQHICQYTASGYANKGSFNWSAPEGEVITNVEFYHYGNYNAGFVPTLYYDLEDGLSADTPIAWETTTRVASSTA